MDEKTTIKAVELVRRIRDEQAASLDGKSTEEVLAFFRRAAEKLREMAAKRVRRPGSETSTRNG